MTRDEGDKSGEVYAVYACVSVNRYLKKVRNEQLYVINQDGEVVADYCGGTIGYYEGRITLRMLKEYVKWFAESEFSRATGLDVILPIRNISLKNYHEINRILDMSQSEIYRDLKDLR